MNNLIIRNPDTDHLLTPKNAACIFIDYQPTQVNSVNSMLRQPLINNVNALAELVRGFDMPIVLTTVNVASGNNKDTIASLKSILTDIPSIDRSTINAWEDVNFHKAVIATGRKKLIIAALWTEACLSFPALDALKEGFEVYPVVDAVGGTSVLAHETALKRVEQAGAKLTSIAQVACELQRDWARKDTAPVMVKALQNVGAFLKF